MPENLKKYFAIGSLVLIVILIILGLVEIKNRVFTQTDLTKTRSIMMSAEGKVSTAPDIANLSFAVVTSGKSAEQVQLDNDKKMQNVIDYIKQNGVEAKDIQTSGYNLYPQYDYNKPDISPLPITGYTLNQNVDVKIRDLNKVSNIVGGLTGKGVNQINNISYSIDDPDGLRAEARSKAIEKAKQKAKDLAQTLDIKLGKVISFSEDSSSAPYPLPYYAERLEGGGTPVQPGSQDITVNVTLTFSIK